MSLSLFQPTTEQAAVIEHNGPAFISACPGAGKTRVLVERARRLLCGSEFAQGIAFLSFTKAAICELESRLKREGLLSGPVFPNFSGTFDSFIWQFFVAPFGCRVVPELRALCLTRTSGLSSLSKARRLSPSAALNVQPAQLNLSWLPLQATIRPLGTLVSPQPTRHALSIASKRPSRWDMLISRMSVAL